jgi:hypothetical protein
MPKQSGMGDNFYLNGYDLSGDINSLSRIGGGPATLPATNITQSAEARMGGVRDGGIDFIAYYNPGPEANAAHTVLSALPTADVIVSYFRGTSLGNPAACEVAKQANYDPTRGQDGSLTFAVNTLVNGFGLEWGVMLTPGIRTYGGGAQFGPGFDTGAAASFGAQAYLQVFAFAGTDATVKIEDSPDNSSWAGLAPAFTFAQTTAAPSAQRIATANTQTVRQWVRASVTTVGGYTNLQFAVVIVKNTVAGQVF